MKHIPLILAIIFLVFAVSGCLVPSTSIGKASNSMRCMAYQLTGFYPNELARRDCK